MTANEFNKIDKTYFLIEEKTKEVCEKNNIDFYDYLGGFQNKLNNYFKNYNQIEVIKNLDFSDKISTRAILNRAFFSTKENELAAAYLFLEQSKVKLFNWLDKVEDPYFFILNPVFKYGAGIGYNSYFSKRYGYKKINHTGIQNLELASDYAIYKLNKKW
jgi:hypothetical protein